MKKTKNLRIRRADALKTEREEATCSHIAHRTTRNSSKVPEPTEQQEQKKHKPEPKFTYIGKPLSQDEINQRRSQGKNVSGMTPLAHMLPGYRQQLEQQQQVKADTIPEATRPTTTPYSRSTKNAPMFIKAVIGQLSDLLGDEPESEPLDINRTAKLYKRSKLAEEDFRNALFDIFRQAKSIPDERVKTRRKDGKPNKMPLFFNLLEERLGLEPETHA